jgi:hypothetical protein
LGERIAADVKHQYWIDEREFKDQDCSDKLYYNSVSRQQDDPYTLIDYFPHFHYQNTIEVLEEEGYEEI